MKDKLTFSAGVIWITFWSVLIFALSGLTVDAVVSDLVMSSSGLLMVALAFEQKKLSAIYERVLIKVANLD